MLELLVLVVSQTAVAGLVRLSPQSIQTSYSSPGSSTLELAVSLNCTKKRSSSSLFSCTTTVEDVAVAELGPKLPPCDNSRIAPGCAVCPACPLPAWSLPVICLT